MLPFQNIKPLKLAFSFCRRNAVGELRQKQLELSFLHVVNPVLKLLIEPLDMLREVALAPDLIVDKLIDPG